MAQTTMYVGQVNSPVTTLSSGISASDTTISVTDATKLVAAPNLLTLGTGEDAETVQMTAKNGNSLTVVRGFEGTAKAWDTGTFIGRMFTNYDHGAFKSNIEDLSSSSIKNRDVDSDVLVTSTSEQTISSYTPGSQGNFLIGIYLRVITSPVKVTMKVSYTDGTGAQINTVLDSEYVEVGSHSLIPVFINAVASAITVSCIAGTANKVYVSSSILGV